VGQRRILSFNNKQFTYDDKAVAEIRPTSQQGSIQRVYSKVKSETKDRNAPCYSDSNQYTHKLKMSNKGETEGSRIGTAPMLISADQASTTLTETIIEDRKIVGFSVGGEKRLCLPQIINTILGEFGVEEIRPVYDDLQIFCALCTSAQLDTLKQAGVLPQGAPSCGLITKTDAERMCSALLHRNGQRCPSNISLSETGRGLDVKHECFGKCRGTFYSGRYVSSDSPAIKCAECLGDFSPEQFVCHSHMARENRTVHWGFESVKWRSYLMLVSDGTDEEPEWEQRMLTEIKTRFDLNRGTIRKHRNDNNVHSEDDDVTQYKVKRQKQEEKLSAKIQSENGSSTVTDVRFVRADRDKKPFDPNVSLKITKSEKESDDFNEGEAAKKERLKNEQTALAEDQRCTTVRSVTQPGSTSIEERLVSVLNTELKVFKAALSQTDRDERSLEDREALLREFVFLQQLDLQLMGELLHTNDIQQQELRYVYRLLKDINERIAKEADARDRQLSELRSANEVKLRESERENQRIREEIEALVNGQKRSDVGLVKAKYKVQAEHFRWKLQAAEQAKQQLESELTELRRATAEAGLCERSYPLTPPTNEDDDDTKT